MSLFLRAMLNYMFLNLSNFMSFELGSLVAKEGFFVLPFIRMIFQLESAAGASRRAVAPFFTSQEDKGYGGVRGRRQTSTL